MGIYIMGIYAICDITYFRSMSAVLSYRTLARNFDCVDQLPAKDENAEVS